MGPTYKCSLESNVVSVTVFELFRVKILTADLLTLAELTPGPKVTFSGDNQLAIQVYHPAKFQPGRTNGLRYVSYQSFSLFGLESPNPSAKVHQKWR